MDLQWTSLATFYVSIVATLIAAAAVLVSYIVYRSQADPEVIVYAEADEKRPSIINLIIENIGNAVAQDVTFTFSSDLPSKAFGLDVATAKDAEKMANGPLVRGIPFLAPRAKRILTWGQYGGLLKALGENSVFVTAKYKSHHPGIPWPIKHITACPLEILSFEATDASDKNYDKQIAKNVEALVKAVEGVAKSMSKEG